MIKLTESNSRLTPGVYKYTMVTKVKPESIPKGVDKIILLVPKKDLERLTNFTNSFFN
jgi:hypothetical protein